VGKPCQRIGGIFILICNHCAIKKLVKSADIDLSIEVAAMGRLIRGEKRTDVMPVIAQPKLVGVAGNPALDRGNV